ncbi:MAG: phytanoyl-CoA dioxygenase family protein [Stigonema ocellatum SAG 48.90 = DSM 106950]|nr:phytanoyl-CoA dioxygenase family protein [Stigonema ocellatum SAG 48.90 = DSM 106950]
MTRPINFTFTSNEKKISNNTEHIGWLLPSNPNAPIQQLKEQYQQQGYLWLKGLLPPNLVRDFRRQFFEKCMQFNLIDEETLPEEGIFSGNQVSVDLINQIRQAAICLKEYNAVCESPAILKFLEKFFGGMVCSSKRKLIRCKVPGISDDTGAHYDFTYFRCGTDLFVTCWIPLGDTPVEMGGLIYLEDSCSFGQLMEQQFNAIIKVLPQDVSYALLSKGMGGIGWISKDLALIAKVTNSRWLLANYEAGDVVIHSPYMIHASCSNLDPFRRIRLSTDVRYHRIDSSTDERWQNIWQPNDGL